MQRIPDLTESETEATGKLNTFKCRRSSGTESGRFQIDLTLLFRIDNIDDARTCEHMFPGVAEEYRRSFGEDSDGKRKREFTRVDQDCRIVLNASEKGRVIFDGTAESRKAQFNVSAKASTLIVHLRCLNADSASGHSAMDFLGEDVDLDLKMSNTVLPFPKKNEDGEVDDTHRETGHNETALIPEVGNLVVVRAEAAGGPPEYGVVRKVSDDGAVSYRDIELQVDSHADLNRIENIVVVSTPKGAKSKPALRKLWKGFVTEAESRGKEACVRDLIVAIAQASGRGLIEQADDGAWPITDAVILLALDAEPNAAANG